MNVFYDTEKSSPTNELIYETEAGSQTQMTELWLPRGRRDGGGMGGGSLGLVDVHFHK